VNEEALAHWGAAAPKTEKETKSPAFRLLILWVRIPQGAWMSVCVVSVVLADKGLCNELITRASLCVI